MSNSFADLFSVQSKDYASFRPRYPKELYEFLLRQVAAHDAVWDCATGNGQAAIDLSGYFKTVYATDASSAQISCAQAASNVQYSVATAESSGLPDQSVDLITVAQALHWFDHPRFFAEAKRVLRPNAVIACWAYGHMTPQEAQVRQVFDRLSREVLHDYWDKRTELVWRGYETMEFPFNDIAAPDFYLTVSWTLPELIGYFSSNSATQTFIEKQGYHPAQPMQKEFLDAWGDPDSRKTITTKMTFKAGRKS